MADTARGLAADLLNEVLLHGRSLTTALESARPLHEARRMAAAQDLAYSVLRQYGRLRLFLDRLSGSPKPPELLGLLLVALLELDDRDTPAYAAVNEAVGLAGRHHPRARGYVNAVLRNFLRRRDALRADADLDTEGHWNFPAWWIDRLRAQYPGQWEDILTAMNARPPMALRVNRRRIGVGDYLALLREAGSPGHPTGGEGVILERPVPVAELPGFSQGLVSVQDPGAQHACALLDCADGMRVLDACAAPGGKTAHLLEIHDLDVTALDQDAGRLARVGETLARLGLHARLLAADAGRSDQWWDGRPFQRILLDAPCTASGVVRRHPDGKWLKRCEDVTTLASRQAGLLDAVWPLLEQGGKLLYATCSLFHEENDDQVESFLRRHSDARREAIRLPTMLDGQLIPNGEHDGFFYARFVKT